MLNGLIQAPGADNDYTLNGTSLVFTEDLDAGDVIQITYIKG